MVEMVEMHLVFVHHELVNIICPQLMLEDDEIDEMVEVHTFIISVIENMENDVQYV